MATEQKDASITPPQFVQWVEGGNALKFAEQYEEKSASLREEVARLDLLARQCRAVHYALTPMEEVQ